MKHCLRILSAIIAISLVMGIPSIDKAYAEYPEKMITYVCIFKAGGGTDRWARVMSSGAKDAFGQFWHVINIPGADGIVGWREALK
ncbi:MAG: hypothetical protein GWN13_16515, partial [Phycisphaerae bacterium]|nr:hypothetical protein [Phycisphaerae bacterium]NIW94184.1 hypothetical protein [Phycisphaerae bacterium]NIW99817.1 hypothetical protein [Phycisphaerae bacterium]